MDINSQQQINTFVGGMNTDTSDAMLDSSQYRFARNLRIVTNTESNTGELRVIEGTGEFIPQNGIIDPEHLENSKTWDEILYMTSVRKYGILITRTGFTWAIWRFIKNNADSLKKIFGDCSTYIWDETTWKCDLSVITQYESEDNIKLYIADGIHSLMSLNISPLKDTQGGPSNDIKTLVGYASTLLPKLNVSVSTSTSGELKAAKVQYAYRLYTKKEQATELSPLSRILSLYKDLNSGYASGDKTGKAVNITLSPIETLKLDRILIYRINYVETGQEPEINLIVDNAFISGSQVDIIDTGKNIKSVSVSEFLSYVLFRTIPKRIESKNNYLFSSNIEYTLSKVDEKFKDVRDNIGNYFSINSRYDTNISYNLSDSYQNFDSQDQNISFRPGEIYRFGVILYDEDGNKTSVFHVKDETILDYNGCDWLSITNNSPYTNPTYVAHPFVVDVSLTQEIQGCSKYEIVRCIRTIDDKSTIMQGLVGRPVELFKKTNGTWNSTKKLTPSGFMSMNLFFILPVDPTADIYYSRLCSNVLQFASPEYVYLRDDVKDLLKRYRNQLSVNIVAEYIPYINKKNNYRYTTYYNSVDLTNQPLLVLSHGPSAYHPYISDSELNPDTMYCISMLHNTSLLSNSYGTNAIEFTRNSVTGHILFNTIMPTFKADSSRRSYSISDFSTPVVPSYGDVAKSGTLRLKDDISYIDEYLYTSWSNPTIPVEDSGDSSDLSTVWKTGVDGQYPVGYNGPNLLFKINSQINANDYSKPHSDNVSWGSSVYFDRNPISGNAQINSAYGPFVISVADLKKPVIPYGGTSDYAKNNSVYYSFGDIFEATTGPTHTITSGDCYINLFKYNALHNWYDSTFVAANKMGTVYEVPIFTDIDLRGQFGSLYNRNLTKGYYIQDKACTFDDYVQETDAYLYNTAYNAHPNLIPNSPSKDRNLDYNVYDVRVHYSEQKTNNEDIDNWTQFKAMNFLDVDSRFGLMTELKLFKDKLVFWLENATGILAVNERVILQDANDTQVTLGSGGILDRYDYISTIYGMKASLHTACTSNDALYWWDGNNKEILQYTDKYSAVPLSLIKNIKNYLNVEDETENPHSYFDRKYKEVVFSCVGYGSVVYNETLQRFTSVYGDDSKYRVFTKFMPTYSTYIDDTLYITDGLGVYLNNVCSNRLCKLFGNDAHPLLKFIVNQNNTLTKTFDMQIIGGELYGGSERIVQDEDNNDIELFQGIDEDSGNHVYHTTNPLISLFLEYKTPLKQTGRINAGQGITNREYDYRLNVPREAQNALYGGRLRGKTMQCELWSISNSIDFSLQYITTKYRMSWS